MPNPCHIARMPSRLPIHHASLDLINEWSFLSQTFFVTLIHFTSLTVLYGIWTLNNAKANKSIVNISWYRPFLLKTEKPNKQKINKTKKSRSRETHYHFCQFSQQNTSVLVSDSGVLGFTHFTCYETSWINSHIQLTVGSLKIQKS